jgi:hypothetical protein
MPLSLLPPTSCCNLNVGHFWPAEAMGWSLLHLWTFEAPSCSLTPALQGHSEVLTSPALLYVDSLLPGDGTISSCI